MKIRHLNHTIVIGSDEDIENFDQVGRLYKIIIQAPFPPQDVILTLIELYLPSLNAIERLKILSMILATIEETKSLQKEIAALQNLAGDLSTQNKSHN